MDKHYVICILQNAWGDYPLPLLFAPNEGNKSCKTIRKVVGFEKTILFCNTTGVVTPTAKGKPKPDYLHFKKVLVRIRKACLGEIHGILICGKQAEATCNKYLPELERLKVPIIHMKHPAARDVSNAYLQDIKNKLFESL